MKTATELQLRKAALVLSALLVLQVIWGGATLLLLDAPEAILPAEASLRVDSVQYGDGLVQGQEPPMGLVARPLFFAGRDMYVPADGAPRPEERRASGGSELDTVELLGVYAGGETPGIIIAQNGKRRRVRLHESIDGWEIVGLNPEGAMFVSGDETRVLDLVRTTPKAVRAVERAESGSRKHGSRAADRRREAAAAASDQVESTVSTPQQDAKDVGKKKDKSGKKKKKNSGKKSDKNNGGNS